MKYDIDIREKALVISCYLSKFDKQAVSAFGFSNYTETRTMIASALDFNVNSIKNYVDEFDPYFENSRQGRHKREMRGYIKAIYDRYYNLDFDAFTELVKTLLYKNNNIDFAREQAALRLNDNTFAKRLITGQAAESYFLNNYKSYKTFANLIPQDTTRFGCGFDYKFDLSNDSFYAVEIKGIQGDKGNIILTEKEYAMSEYLTDRYYLYVVKNLTDNPYPVIYNNPTFSGEIDFKKSETSMTIVNWSSYV